MIGIKIKKAGMLINPMLSGIFACKKDPDIKKPIAPNKAITEPIAAALPIAFLMGFRTFSFACYQTSQLHL